MISNYLIVAIRGFMRSPLFSSINILGLAIGIAASVFLFLFVWDEFSYDRFHTKGKNIYRVITHNMRDQTVGVVTPGPLAPALAETHKEIVNVARIGKWSGTIAYGDNLFPENEIYFADHSLFQVFDFPILLGSRENLLTQSNEIVLTEKTAAKYFGSNWRANEKLLGTSLTMNGNEIFSVAGVVADPPANSSIQFDFLLSFEHVVKFDKWGYQWGSHNFHTYILKDNSASPVVIANNIKNELLKQNVEAGFTLDLQPLYDIYLQPLPGYDWGKHGDKQYVVIFFVIGIIILVVACFNYVNLSTARAAKRAKEVGVRKSAGAERKQLFWQFFFESTMLVACATLLSRALIDIFLPVFNQLSGKNLKTTAFQWEIVLLLGLVAIFTSLLAGIYPAVILSSMRAVNILKGTFVIRGKNFRSLLVTAQFTISLILIIGTVIIFQQVEFVQHSNTGFNRSSLAYIKLGGSLRRNSEGFKNDITSLNYISNASRSTSTLVNTDNGSWIEWPGKKADQEVTFSQMNVDHDFLPLMQIPTISGRNFLPSDSMKYILNEKGVQALGLTAEEALGMTVKFWGTEGQVIGIVKDFHFRPLHHEIAPLIIRHAPKENYFNLMVRVDKKDIERFMADGEKLFKRHTDDYPFQLSFVNDQVLAEYQREQRAGNVILYFSILSIFICLVGLFGLVRYDIQVRTKEFGIRKILGASTLNIFTLIGRNFLSLFCAATILTTPVAYWLGNQWLSNFAYRINIQPSFFLITFAAVALGACAMIAAQAFRAARKNSVEALRTE